MRKKQKQTAKEIEDGHRSLTSLLMARLSPSEALSISGVTQNTLATWYKRALLPAEFSEISPGHGKRRGYSVQQAIVLAIARTLIDSGCPVEVAMFFASFERASNPATSSIQVTGGGEENYFFTLANSVFSYVVQGLGKESGDVGKALKEERYPLALIWRTPEGALGASQWAHGVFRAHGFVLYTGLDFDDIPAVMRNRGRSIAAAIIVDKCVIAARILDRVERVIAARRGKTA